MTRSHSFQVIDLMEYGLTGKIAWRMFRSMAILIHSVRTVTASQPMKADVLARVLMPTGIERICQPDADS